MSPKGRLAWIRAAHYVRGEIHGQGVNHSFFRKFPALSFIKMLYTGGIFSTITTDDWDYPAGPVDAVHGQSSVDRSQNRNFS